MKPIILALVLTLGFSSPQHAQAQISLVKPVNPPVQILPAIALIKPLPAAHFAAVAPLAPATPPPPPGLPVSPAGTYANTYDYGNCTEYVASRIKVPNSWGNANTWAANAQAEGITVSATPRVGAIAQSTAGGYGHVAVVVAVGDGTVTVDEMNVHGLAVVDEATYPVSAFNNYIYV